MLRNCEVEVHPASNVADAARLWARRSYDLVPLAAEENHDEAAMLSNELKKNDPAKPWLFSSEHRSAPQPVVPRIYKGMDESQSRHPINSALHRIYAAELAQNFTSWRYAMRSDGIIGKIGQQEWVNPAAEGLQKLIHKAFPFRAGGKQKNLLHGTWIGHPLHVILTDVPIGGWTTAIVFDALDSMNTRRQYRIAADTAVTFGLVSAVGVAAAGVTDWQDIDPPAMRKSNCRIPAAHPIHADKRIRAGERGAE